MELSPGSETAFTKRLFLSAMYQMLQDVHLEIA